MLPALCPPRICGIRKGAPDIASIPPATTIPALPARIRSWPSITAFIPEPQTLLIVLAPVASASPAARAACRAGA